MEIVGIRLTRKLADCIDGVDLSRWSVGETIRLEVRDALLLIAEGWAEPVQAERGEPDWFSAATFTKSL
jgi:hypothetical protein